MRTRKYWRVYLSVIASLWVGTTRVTYPAFVERLAEWRQRLRKAKQVELQVPSQPTFSRVWSEFCRGNKLGRGTRRAVRETLLRGVSEGSWDPGAADDEAASKAARYLSQRGIIPPVPAELLRRIRTIRSHLRRRKQEARDQVLARALGTVLSSLPLAKRFKLAKELLRYPPAGLGKAGVAKLDAEDVIRAEIEETLKANGLSLEVLLSRPELEEAFEFVDRRATSTLQRWEKREVIRAIPLYLAARHQQAVDALLFTFVRLARLLKLRVKASYDEQVEDTNRALFERRAPEFKQLRRAVLSALENGDPSVLKPFGKLLRDLEERGEEASTQQGYYLLLASRGTFARKLSHRLKGVAFEGRDSNARAIVEALGEVLRFAPLSEEVPRRVRDRLAFLDVSSVRLANRRVFETVVLITLADLLWLGRITSPHSRRFGDLWSSIVAAAKGEKTKAIAEEIRRARANLGRAWADLRRAGASPDAVKNGRLVSRRPPRKRTHEEEALAEKAKQEFLSKLRPVSIVDVLTEVHRSTGMLDAVRLDGGRGRRLPDDQRRRLALAVILARGMNVGVAQMSTLLGRWYTLGRLKNFDESYIIARALERANGVLLDSWDRKGLGRTWGDGGSVAADGRSIVASERSLQSGYHYRHRRSGVTLYWLVRNDWIGARVGVIPAHDWESWYLLNGILAPLGGRAADWAAGDTHGQHLALWGLSFLLGKEVRARFRRLSSVKLYRDGRVSGLPVRGVLRIRWFIVERSVRSLAKLLAAVRSGKVSARDVLRASNLYDENGINVAEALRELGKAVRTAYVIRYALTEDTRREVREACNRAETWNSFQEDVFWGNGGRMQTNDPRRREVNALCMQLVMNSIVYYNAEKHGARLARIQGSSPVTWEHVRRLGDYRITLSRRHVDGRGSK